MQRRVLFGAGLAALALLGFLALRSTTNHQATRAVDQGIDQLLARLPPGYAVRHGATDANPLTGSLTLHDVVVTHDGATVLTAGQVTVSGVDRQALQDVFDPANYPAGRPAWSDRRLLIADAASSDVHVTIPGADFTQRSYTLHRLSGRPFIRPPTPENRGRADFLADAALAFSVDSIEGRDAVSRSLAKAQVTSKVGKLALSDYDSGKVGSLAYKDLAIDGNALPRGGALHFAMASLDIKSLDLRGVLEQVRATGHADRGQLGKIAYESGDVSGVAFDMADGPHVGIDDMHASQTGTDAGSSGKGSVRGFTMALGQTRLPPAAAPGLAAFGMTALTMDVDATAHSSAADRRTSLHEDLVLRNLGTLRVDATVTGYDAALAGPGHPLGAVLGATLDRATVTYEDASLVNRLIAVAVAQGHTTPEQIRAQLAMPVAALGVMLPDQPDAADQVGAFLDHPGTLTVTMAPPQKLTFGEVARAPVTTRAHLLGLHVTSR